MHGEEKKKINLKMNINKYDIKYYVSETKLEKFLKNMKMKDKYLSLTNRNNNDNIKVNNLFNKILRPNSSPGKKVINRINISQNNLKRVLTTKERIFSENNILNNNQSNNTYNNFIRSNSTSRKITEKKIKKKTQKKFSIDSDIEIKTLNTFGKDNQRIILKKNKKNDSNKNPLNLSFKNDINRRISQPINFFKIKKTNETNSETLDSNEPISKLYNSIKSDRTELNSDYYRRKSNPLNHIIRNIFSDKNKNNNKLKSNFFKKKVGKKRNESFYDRIKEKKQTNDSKNKFTFIIDKENNENNNNIEENIEFGKDFVKSELNQKFIKEQFKDIKYKIVNIKKRKNIIYAETLKKQINNFYNFISQKEKILLKKEVKNNFAGKDKTLKKIYLSFLNKISKDALVKFLFIIYKLYYKVHKFRRIIRSFYTISFPFLLDKYLNPRKGVLTLIFVFGIERKTFIRKPRRKLSKNNTIVNQTYQFSSFKFNNSENNSYQINSYYSRNKTITNLKLVNNTTSINLKMRNNNNINNSNNSNDNNKSNSKDQNNNNSSNKNNTKNNSNIFIKKKSSQKIDNIENNNINKRSSKKSFSKKDININRNNNNENNISSKKSLIKKNMNSMINNSINKKSSKKSLIKKEINIDKINHSANKISSKKSLIKKEININKINNSANKKSSKKSLIKKDININNIKNNSIKNDNENNHILNNKNNSINKSNSKKIIFTIDKNENNNIMNKSNSKQNINNNSNYNSLNKSIIKSISINNTSRNNNSTNNMNGNKTLLKTQIINSQLIRKKMEFFPEKITKKTKIRLKEIKNLLDIAYEKEENILFINDMINSDTRNNIVNKSFFKKSYEKKKRFIHLFSKSLIKNTEKYSLKKKNRKSIINNRKSLALIRESDEIEFINRKSILSSQKILIDNITEKYATRKKTSKIKKKFCRDIQISNNLFSSTNQEITKLKTQMIKASFLKTIEDNLYKVIFYYIKEENLMLIEKYIIDNYGFMNMNYTDELGFTFLNCAVKYNCKKEIIQFLLIKGCNPNIPNVNIIYI